MRNLSGFLTPPGISKASKSRVGDVGDRLSGVSKAPCSPLIWSIFSEARVTSAPAASSRLRGSSSSESSKPSVAMIKILASEMAGMHSSSIPVRPCCGTEKRGGSGEFRNEAARVALDRRMTGRPPALRYVDDSQPGITRKRHGRYWQYFDAEGNASPTATRSTG